MQSPQDPGSLASPSMSASLESEGTPHDAVVFPGWQYQHSADLREQNSRLEEEEKKALGGDGGGGGSVV